MNQEELNIHIFNTPLILLRKISLIVLTTVLLVSCSNSKNKPINRVYHNATAKYNVLFNGRNSLEKAEEIIVDNYKEDFKEILPISPFETGMSAMKARSHLKKVDDKAAKAIQKHSMNIGGVEYNQNIDEAYLLLGKSRYYQTKFLPALEAFNFVVLNFRSGKVFYEAQLWSARTQIELANYSLAASNISFSRKNIAAQ